MFNSMFGNAGVPVWGVGAGWMSPLPLPGTALSPSIERFPCTIQGVSSPASTFVSITRTKLSDETGCTTATATFRVTDSSCVAWEARATNESVAAENRNGAIVGSGGSVAMNGEVLVDVDYTELLEGDRTYTIRLYVQAEGGAWY